MTHREKLQTSQNQLIGLLLDYNMYARTHHGLSTSYTYTCTHNHILLGKDLPSGYPICCYLSPAHEQYHSLKVDSDCNCCYLAHLNTFSLHSFRLHWMHVPTAAISLAHVLYIPFIHFITCSLCFYIISYLHSYIAYTLF